MLFRKAVNDMATKWEVRPEDITEEKYGTDWEYYKADAEARQKKLAEGFHIPACNFDHLQHKLGQLARRFKRVGKVSDIKLEVVNEYTTVPDKKKPWEVRTWYVCKVEGSVPKYDGWEFVAKIRHEAEGNYISCRPGEELAPSWREVKPFCAHCQTVRRRAETFVLRHENGDLVQIGRNCIRDFLGGADPRDLADASEWLREACGLADEAEDALRWGRSWPESYPLLTYLENVAAIMRHEDGKYRKETTPGTAFQNMKGEPYERTRYAVTPAIEPTEDDRLAAFTAIVWLRWHNETADTVNDYFHNLGLLLKKDREEGGAFAYRQMNLAASILKAWKNWAARQVEQKAKEAARPSEYFGTVGKRADYTLTLERSTWYETDYGTRYVLILRDQEGNRAVWKTGSGYGLEPGDVINCRATVKEHSEYNDEKQTVLQRVDW
jgi:ribosomal protein L36